MCGDGVQRVKSLKKQLWCQQEATLILVFVRLQMGPTTVCDPLHDCLWPTPRPSITHSMSVYDPLHDCLWPIPCLSMTHSMTVYDPLHVCLWPTPWPSMTHSTTVYDALHSINLHHQQPTSCIMILYSVVFSFFQELVKFAKYILSKFFELLPKNPMLFAELVVWKSAGDCYEIMEGYGSLAVR